MRYALGIWVALCLPPAFVDRQLVKAVRCARAACCRVWWCAAEAAWCRLWLRATSHARWVRARTLGFDATKFEELLKCGSAFCVAEVVAAQSIADYCHRVLCHLQDSNNKKRVAFFLKKKEGLDSRAEFVQHLMYLFGFVSDKVQTHCGVDTWKKKYEN